MSTVRELIARLEEFPLGAPVMLSTYGCGTIFRYEFDASRIYRDEKTGELIIEAEDN